MEKYPEDLLREVLSQRGKIIASVSDPFSDTFLRFIKSKKANRDFLYNELSNRAKRNELLFAIYNDEPMELSDGTIIETDENSRNLYSSSFEWYVAELLYREFKFYASAFGIKLQGSPHGGDFDVIGATHTGLVAIECKSGKPRGIDESQINHFVMRHNFIRADYSILYIDYKGLKGEFPFAFLSQAVHGKGNATSVYKIVSNKADSNANFYAVDGASIYVVDNSKNTGNVIKNLRLAIDTHYAIKNSHNRTKPLDRDVLKEFYGLELEMIR